MRRDGLYTSLAEWRKARDAGVRAGLSAKARAGRSPEQVEVEKLRRRNERLEEELARTAWRWRSREKRMRSWSCSPRARTPTPSRSRDRRPPRGFGCGDLDQAGVRAAGRVPGYPLPAAAAPEPTPGPVARPAPSNALPEAERQHIVAVLRSEEYCDLAPAQVWARLLDDGVYLCSISTMYRLLAVTGESRERRRQRTHPARKRPELIACRPNQVWSWDITKLQGPERGFYYELFVILDIFSRYVVGWTVSQRETGELAEAFIADTLAATGSTPAS